MKTRLHHSASAIVLALCTLPALAQGEATPQVASEMRKVDTDNGRLTIRHQRIPNLDMAPMTMVFKAAPAVPALLQQARQGQQVSFSAERVDGALTLTSLTVRGAAP